MELMGKKSTFRYQSGQILLIVLLIMVVGLTVGLAVIARSVTSIKISTEEEDSQKAFYAAEAGLEELLLPGAVGDSTSGNFDGASYTATIAKGTIEDNSFNFHDETIPKDDTRALWLSEHTSEGTSIADPSVDDYDIRQTVDVCWSNPGGETPAMEVIVLYQNIRVGASYKRYYVARGAYDPNSGRVGNNNFELVSSIPACGTDFPNGKTIRFSDFGLVYNTHRAVALRLRPVYNGTKILVRGNVDTLPSQEREIQSLGTAGADNTVQRKLKVTRSYPTLPPIFDFVLFSGQNLEKKAP